MSGESTFSDPRNPYAVGDVVLAPDPHFGGFRAVVREVNGPMLRLQSEAGGPPLVYAYDRVCPIPAIELLADLAECS